MIFFLFVPTESGQSEMVALEATRLEDAITEARETPFAGRTGFLFDGDRFVREIMTADTIGVTPALSTLRAPKRPTPPVELAPRPG